MLKLEFIENLTSVINGSKNVYQNDKQAQNWILTNSELNKILK